MSFTFDESIAPEYVGGTCAYRIEVSKVGGGTVGKEYAGAWQYQVLRHGKVILKGANLETGTPHTHRWVARHLRDCYVDGELV